MNSFTRTILASALAVCASQAALGASVIPHASIPGLVDFAVPFTQNGTVVMSEKYDVFRPNREVADSFKLRPDGYADFVEYHFKHLSPDEPTVEVTRVHVPSIRRAEVDKAVAFYVDQMAKSSGETFVKKGSNYLSETFDIIVDGTSIAVMVAPAVAQAAEIEALMKRKDYRMRIGAVTLGIDSKGAFFRTVPRDEYSGTGWKNSKPELVIEVVELLKNRIAVNASLGNHVNVEDASASRRALIAKLRTEIHDYPAKPELAKGLF